MNQEKKLLIEMIMRQTTYTYEECETKLNENENNYMKIIKEFHGIKEKPAQNITINQGIIKEIRELMDNAGNNFRIKQDIEKKAKEYYKQQNDKLLESQKLNKIS